VLFRPIDEPRKQAKNTHWRKVIGTDRNTTIAKTTGNFPDQIKANTLLRSAPSPEQLQDLIKDLDHNDSPTVGDPSSTLRIYRSPGESKAKSMERKRKKEKKEKSMRERRRDKRKRKKAESKSKSTHRRPMVSTETPESSDGFHRNTRICLSLFFVFSYSGEKRQAKEENKKVEVSGERRREKLIK
jgi:hypothetical protein